MVPDLNRLRIFCHVFSLRNVSRAARELKITQPAVSQHLKKLEKELRVPLFTRMNKRMVPTPAAERLFARTAPFLEDLASEVKFLRRPLDTPFGKLRIGVNGVLGDSLLPRVCNHFRLRFPTVTFSLKVDREESLLSDLQDGALDFVLVPHLNAVAQQFINPLTFSTEVLFTEYCLLVCARSYYVRKGIRQPSFDLLVRQDFIANEADDDLTRRWFRHNFGKAPVDLPSILISNSRPAIKAAITTGMGLGVLPHHQIREELQAKTLIPIETKKKPLANKILLVHLCSREMTHTETVFISAMKKEIEQSALDARSLSIEVGVEPPSAFSPEEKTED